MNTDSFQHRTFYHSYFSVLISHHHASSFFLPSNHLHGYPPPMHEDIYPSTFFILSSSITILYSPLSFHLFSLHLPPSTFLPPPFSLQLPPTLPSSLQLPPFTFLLLASSLHPPPSTFLPSPSSLHLPPSTFLPPTTPSFSFLSSASSLQLPPFSFLPSASSL